MFTLSAAYVRTHGVHTHASKKVHKQVSKNNTEWYHTSFECVVNGNGAPAASIVHDGAVDGLWQTAWVAPR